MSNPQYKYNIDQIVNILSQSSISQNDENIPNIYPKYEDLKIGRKYYIKNIDNTNGSKLLITIDVIGKQKQSDNTFQLAVYVKLPSTEDKDTRIVLNCKITDDSNIEITFPITGGKYILMVQYIDKFIENALLPNPTIKKASELLVKFNQSAQFKNCEKSFLGSEKCTTNFFKKLAGGKSGAFVYKVKYNTSSDPNKSDYKDCAFKIWKPRPKLFNTATDAETARDQYFKENKKDGDLTYFRSLKEIEMSVKLDNKFGDSGTKNPITPKTYEYGFVDQNPLLPPGDIDNNQEGLYPYQITEFIDGTDFNKFPQTLKTITDTLKNNQALGLDINALRRLIILSILAKISDVMVKFHDAFTDSNGNHVGCHRDLHPGNIMVLNDKNIINTILDKLKELKTNAHSPDNLIGPDVRLIDFDLSISDNPLINRDYVCSRNNLGTPQLLIGNVITGTSNFRRKNQSIQSNLLRMPSYMSNNADLKAWGNLYISLLNDIPHCENFDQCFFSIKKIYNQELQKFLAKFEMDQTPSIPSTTSNGANSPQNVSVNTDIVPFSLNGTYNTTNNSTNFTTLTLNGQYVDIKTGGTLPININKKTRNHIINKRKKNTRKKSNRKKRK